MKLKLLLLAAIPSAILHAQEADPFRESKSQSAPAAPAPRAVANLSFCYETFSLPLSAAAKLQREQLADSELYKRVLAALEKNAARQESLMVLRSRSGQKAMSDSVSEQMSPGSYSSPELPNSVGVALSPPQPKDGPTPLPEPANLKDAPGLGSLEGIRTPASPGDFQTRKIGTTLEIEATLDESGTIVDLIAAPSVSALAGRLSWGQGLSASEFPIIETQSIHTASALRINQPFLLGTINRPSDSKIDPDSANRVWFAFVTATLAKP